MSHLPPFHLAIQVRNIEEARAFYGELMELPEGRSDKHWVDFNLYGHQLVCHLNPSLGDDGKVANYHNDVDKHAVPVPHFGVILGMQDWSELSEKLKQANVTFIIEPYIRFKGQKGEQATLFFLDPSGNALEFKSFKNIQQQLFAK